MLCYRLQYLYRDNSVSADGLIVFINGHTMAENIEDHGTYDGANRVSLCGISLFLSIIDDYIEESVVTVQRPANLAAALQMEEYLFAHKLRM